MTSKDYAKYTPDFENEAEVQSWLEEQFEQAGWTAIREVSPHHSDERADLIVRNEVYGWIGIETNHLRSTDQGGKISSAIRQVIEKYQHKKYLDDRVNAWCIAPYYTAQTAGQRSYEHTIRDVVCGFGLGYMSFDHHSLMINFNYNRSETKIWVDYMPGYEYRERGDLSSEYGNFEEIEEWVKRNSFHPNQSPR